MADKTKKVLAIDLHKKEETGYVSTLETITNLTGARIDRIPGPTNLAITAQQIAKSMANPQVDVGLAWTPPALITPDIYQIQWSKNVSFSGIFTAASQSNLTSIRVDAGTAYYVRVAAQKGVQVSEWSNVVSFTSISDTTVPPAPSGIVFAWNNGHLEIRPAINSQTLKDLRLRFYNAAGAILYKDVYVTSPYTLTAEENIRMTNGSPLTSLLVRANNRSWSNVESTNTDTTTTSPIPSGISSLAHSWSGDAGIASADLEITWAQSAGASKYVVEINNNSSLRYTTPVPYFTYPFSQNQIDFVSASGVATFPFRVWAANDIAQSGVASSTTATNAAPIAPSITLAAGFSQISAQVGGYTTVRDRKFYRYRIIPPSGASITLDTDSPTYTYDTQLTGNYQVGVRIVDMFHQQGNETVSSAVFVDTLTISGLRSQARYRDSIGTAESILAGLKNTDTSTNVVQYASGTAWKWTECIRDLTDRYNIITVYNDQSATQMYVATSVDGSNWRWFSGALTSDRILTEVANESAAITNAVSYSAILYNRLEVPIHDARVVRLYSRNTGSAYWLREYYPRRMLQSDDIQAETIQAINIAANAINANHISAGAIDGKLITGATIRTSASNPKIILTSVSGLQAYNSSGIEEIRLSTSDGQIYAGQNNVIIGYSGIKVAIPATATNVTQTYQFVTYSGLTIAYLGGYYVKPNTSVIELDTARTYSINNTIRLQAYTTILNASTSNTVELIARYNPTGSTDETSTISTNTINGIRLTTDGNTSLGNSLYMSMRATTGITISGMVGIGAQNFTPTANLDVLRGSLGAGAAIIRGTEYSSGNNCYFMYGATEEVFLRAGKSGSSVVFNDNHTGRVQAGATLTEPASARFTVRGEASTGNSVNDNILIALFGNADSGNQVGIAVRSYRTIAGSDWTGHATLLQRYTDTTYQSPYISFDPNGRLGVNVLAPSYEFQISSDSAGKPGTNTWTIVSDRRAKITESIRPFTDGLEIVEQLQPIYFKYNGKAGTPNDGKEFVGLDAQEIEGLTPRMIKKFKGKIDDQEEDILGLDNGELVYLLLNAVKTLSTRIQSLEAINGINR